MFGSVKPPRRAGVLIPVLLLAFAPVASAGTNSPVPADGPGYGTCPLTRIGTQFVRCDDLTGAGVPAPFWIPEQQ